jgi:hypothetical protein
VNFTIVQGTNVSFVYCLDAYKPLAGLPLSHKAYGRRSRNHATRFQSNVGILIVVLHEPLDCRDGLYQGIWNNGWYQRCYFDSLDPVLFLWEEDPCCDASCQVFAMG